MRIKMRINMSPEEKFEEEKWWVLRKLQYLDLETPKLCRYTRQDRRGNVIIDVPRGIKYLIEIPSRKSGELPLNTQINILKQLADEGLINLFDEEYVERVMFSKYLVIIDVLQPKFNKIYEQYKRKFLGGSANEKKMEKIDLPQGAGWADITMKFKNQYELEVHYKENFLKIINNEILGFFKKNSKDKTPTKQWELLQQMAIQNGKFSLSGYTPQQREKYRQRKMVLSEGLNALFGLEEEPILESNSEYITKFKLEPEPDLRDNGKNYRTKEIQKQYLPSVDTL